LATMRR